MDYNPYLTRQPSGGRGSLEALDNLEWQTRAAAPSEYENRLAEALEQVFAAGAETLAEVVAALNARQAPDPSGAPWTEASFEQAMRRLGA